MKLNLLFIRNVSFGVYVYIEKKQEEKTISRRKYFYKIFNVNLNWIK